jgi:hypothetical protein
VTYDDGDDNNVMMTFIFPLTDTEFCKSTGTFFFSASDPYQSFPEQNIDGNVLQQ